MDTVRHIVDRYAQANPNDLFLISPESGQTIRYHQLQQHLQQVAAYLDFLAIPAGDKVAFLLPNGYWSCVLFLGIMYSGRVVVPLNAVSGNEALRYVIGHCDCRLIFVNDEFSRQFADVLEQRPTAVQLIASDVDTGPQWSLPPQSPTELPITEEQDTALLIYTSGTTGRPKGVLLSHQNVVAGGRNTMQAHDLKPSDRALCVLPLYHINAEMVTVMGPLVSGGCLVIPQRFSCRQFWQQIAEHGCTWFSVVPTIVAYLLEYAQREGFDRQALEGIQSLRFGRSASAALAPEMHKAFEACFGVPLVETMGLTETAAQILSNPMPPEKPKYGSPGKAVGNEAKIIDEQGKPCPTGVSGELLIRGDNVTKGYYKNEQATRDALTADGWFHTGDVAMQDEEGFFFITGRIKELIIKGGENIAPREIDEALYNHPAVLEAAGFAYPDERYGQEVMACVSLKPNMCCSESELLDLSVEKLGEFKAPKRIFFLNELPKGPSGKIQRLKLPQFIAEL